VNEELLALSQGLQTSWPPLADLLLARKVNLAHGGALVGAWEIPQLDEATLVIMQAFVDDFSGMQGGQAKVEAHLANWRNSHPTYRKHVRH
jgi:hypothetical protein